MRLFLLLILLILISCSEKEDRIAVLLTGKGRLQKLEGFKKGLKDLGIKNIKIDVYIGDNNLKTLEELIKKIKRNIRRYKLVAAGGSIEAYFLKKYGVNEIVPVVILGGTSIKEWGLTKSFLRPSENITGVDNLNAELMAKRVELFSKIFPEVKKVIVFCTPKFEASKKAARITIKTGEKLGIKVVPVYVKDVKELEFVISHMKEDGYGAIIMTPCYYTENFLTHYILHYAGFYGVPVFCHNVEFVKKGCPIGYGTSGFKQGYTASVLAYKILKGKPVSEVPFEKVYSPVLVINEKSLYEVGIGFNRELMVLADEVIK
ncbi:ABC transporter substrate-binding protein [Aquifex pyrophilus]